MMPSLYGINSLVNNSLRSVHAHPRRHGLRQRISHRTLFPRGDDPTAGAGELVDDSVFYRGEGVGFAEVVLNFKNLLLQIFALGFAVEPKTAASRRPTNVSLVAMDC